MKPKYVVSIVAFLLLLIVLFSWNSIFPAKPVVTLSDPSNLPGLQTGTVPWQAEITHLAERLRTVGEPALSMEGAALHIHQHLDIYIDNNQVTVPAGIGINQSAGFISPLHTHDDSGVMHVESPSVQTFTLGQFFDIWGVRFTANCIGGYCVDATHSLAVYLNGAPYTGDPRTLPLAQHQEIAIAYGTNTEAPKTIPLSFDFPAGE